MLKLPTTLKGVLRSPRLIVGEILVITLLCAIGASLPQAGSATDAELARLHGSGPLVSALVSVLSLDHVFRSGWFFGATLLAAASLVVVIRDQIRRLWAAWNHRPAVEHFRSAPFQVEFERASRSVTTKEALRIWTENRVGITGSVVLHAGLLLVMCAGALRALFGCQAVVDLVEGETLPADAAAWSAQWPGLWAGPIQLANPVTLTGVKADLHENGDLRDMKVQLSVSRKGYRREEQVAVNRDLRLGGGRVYLGSDYGPTALLEWGKSGVAASREAVLMADKGGLNFEGVSSGANGLRAHVRARLDKLGNRPSLVEVRVMRENALLLSTVARPGQNISLPNAETLSLLSTPFWVRLHGCRDSSLWLAYSGFGLIMVGAVLIFAVTKVDCCLVVTPLGERERVFVALRPQRFVPLFQEHFQRLVREQGGPQVKEESFPAPRPARNTGERELHSCRGSCRTCVRRTLVGPCAGAHAHSGAALGLLLVLCAAGVTGCGRSKSEEALRLVQRYNEVVAEAYRRGDVKLIDPVVGPNEGKKITGLIGVRQDLGLTLDSHLLSLEVTSTEKEKDEWRVHTRERWQYRDLKIGSGEQVGEESLDSYEMLYIFKKIDKAWLVDEIQFVSTPQVGRKKTPWLGERAPHRDIAENSRTESSP